MLESKNDSIHLAAGSAGMALLVPDPGETWKVEYIEFVPSAAVTANGTDYISMRSYKGTGTGTPLHAAVTTASTGLTAGTPLKFGPSGATPTPDTNFSAGGTDLEVTSANPLTFQVTHAGSGKAVHGTVNAYFRRIRAVA